MNNDKAAQFDILGEMVAKCVLAARSVTNISPMLSEQRCTQADMDLPC